MTTNKQNSKKSKETMKSNWKDQLPPRSNSTLSKNQTSHEEVAPNILLSSPCDWGVMRNGGKNGARFAPEVLLSNFKKMANHDTNNFWSHHVVTSSNRNMPAQDFEKSQQESASNIQTLLKNCHPFSSLIHLAAGHDHVYPLTKALMDHYEKVTILNIDAHLDTRKDALPHSGTPFRQIYSEFGPSRVNLAQVGIHQYANVPDNFNDMGNMNVLTMEAIKVNKDLSAWLDKTLAFDQGPLILSLDCDGLDGAIMPAVSAVNHHGLNKQQMNIILEASLKYWHKYQWPRIFGLYEYNPLFDDLQTTSGRYLASLIHKVYIHA